MDVLPLVLYYFIGLWIFFLVHQYQWDLSLIKFRRKNAFFPYFFFPFYFKVFGLHPNADITYQTNLANETLNTIVSIQPKDSGSGGGETREAVVQRLADEMLEKLPPDYNPHEVYALLMQLFDVLCVCFIVLLSYI